MSSPFKFLGLDQSLANTGIAVLAGNSIVLSTLKTNTKDGMGKRLAVIEQFVKDSLLFSPQTVYIEEAYFNRVNSKEQSGVIVKALLEKALYEVSLPYRVMPADARKGNSWRRPLGLTNKQKKEEPKATLQAQTESDINEHEADAWGILMGGLILDGQITAEQAWQFPIRKVNYGRFSFSSVSQHDRDLAEVL